MKHLKKCFAVVLAVAMVLSMSVCAVYAESSVYTASEVEDSLPGTLRYYYWEGDAWGTTTSVELADPEGTISGLKSSSSNLKVAITGRDYNYDSDSVDSLTNTYEIGIVALKEGTYTVSFNILTTDGQKVKTHKFKVYAYEAPVKSVTLGGSSASKLTGTSGVCKVSLKSGYTLKKIQIGKSKIATSEDGDRTISSSEIKYTTISNGDKVTHGKVPDTYTSDQDSDTYTYHYSYINGFAYTTVKITYYDKYTKKNQTYETYFYKKVK